MQGKLHVAQGFDPGGGRVTLPDGDGVVLVGRRAVLSSSDWAGGDWLCAPLPVDSQHLAGAAGWGTQGSQIQRLTTVAGGVETHCAHSLLCFRKF